MPAAPIGAVVTLFVDTRLPLDVNDYVRTGTGRTYQVLSIRQVQRGKHAGIRRHLRVLVVPPDTPAPGDHVMVIQWYSRNRRR